MQMIIKSKPPSKEYDAGWERIFGGRFKPYPGGGVVRTGGNPENALFHGEPRVFNIDKNGNIDEPGRPVHGLPAPQQPGQYMPYENHNNRKE